MITKEELKQLWESIPASKLSQGIPSYMVPEFAMKENSVSGLGGSPTTDVPEIPRLLNMLKEQLQRTQKDLQTLAERLNPIMLPPAPKQDENMKMPIASATQTGIEIEALLLMTDSIQKTIRHLQHSIQI